MSKPDMVTLISMADGKPCASLGLEAYDGRIKIKRNGEKKEMRFKSGKLGFFAGGKVQIDGEVYQASCSFVKLGTTVSAPPRSFTAEQIAEMNRQREATQQDDDHDESHELTVNE